MFNARASAACFLALAVLYGACRVETPTAENTFELKGLHAELTCEDCHAVDAPIGPLPTDCASCHLQDAPPLHFDPPCEACHDEFGWDTAVDHGFLPLQNAHELACTSCHVDGSFTGLDAACSSCHEPDRPQPDHNPGFECSACHVPTTWADAVDHTFFPLVESHSVACASCHANIPDFTGNESTCTSCHEPERPPPNHFTGTDCDSCHSAVSWTDWTYDHFVFPLIDSHQPLPCSSCHASAPGDFSGESSDCASCHEADRPAPDHFVGQDCGECHEATAWDDGVAVDHDFFPLVGNHNRTCAECHPNAPDYTGASAACASCHETDRPAPDHFAGQDCGDCHVLDGWDVGVANHDFFPLVNEHALDCVQCHPAAPADYTGQTDDCSSCHEPDRPGCHFTGETCSNCHDTSATWLATATSIDHAARFTFPFPHRDATQCADCHDTPNSQCDFDCLDCHGDAPGDHGDVNGFQNTSTACVDSGCHPDGQN